MVFRNLKTGNLLHVENQDVIDTMASSPNYERIASAVATPPAPSESPTTSVNKGENEGGENAAQKPQRKAKK